MLGHFCLRTLHHIQLMFYFLKTCIDGLSWWNVFWSLFLFLVLAMTVVFCCEGQKDWYTVQMKLYITLPLLHLFRLNKWFHCFFLFGMSILPPSPSVSWILMHAYYVFLWMFMYAYACWCMPMDIYVCLGIFIYVYINVYVSFMLMDVLWMIMNAEL